jgi:hypothetical protein
MSWRPPDYKLEVEGVGPVSDYNFSMQRFRAGEADNYWYYGFGKRLLGEECQVKRIGPGKSPGGFKRICRTR